MSRARASPMYSAVNDAEMAAPLLAACVPREAHGRANRVPRQLHSVQRLYLFTPRARTPHHDLFFAARSAIFLRSFAMRRAMSAELSSCGSERAQIECPPAGPSCCSDLQQVQ